MQNFSNTHYFSALGSNIVNTFLGLHLLSFAVRTEPADLRTPGEREAALGRACGAQAAPGALRQDPGAHADASGEPQLPGQHQRAPAAGAGPGAGAAPGGGGAAALELQGAQEDPGAVPWQPQRRAARLPATRPVSPSLLSSGPETS